MRVTTSSLFIFLASLAGCSSGDGGGDVPENPGGDPGSSNSSTCAATDDWDPEWSQLEEDILTLVNEQRAKGATCGGKKFDPTHPLKMDPALQCAARLHSMDMADREFFAHDNPSGEDPWERIEDAGYEGSASAENIAAGNGTAAGTMEQWMSSNGHCSNIMGESNFIGVGYYPGGEWGHLWTQTFGR